MAREGSKTLVGRRGQGTYRKGQTMERLRMADEQNTAGPQALTQTVQGALLVLPIKVYKYITTKDHVRHAIFGPFGRQKVD